MRFLVGFLLTTCALAQAPTFVPLIDPRGVVDYFNPAPAPATVARGGILRINGTNLGPATTLTAKGALPTTLGNPAVQATLNGAPMPLFSVSAESVIAQIPYAAPTGLVTIVVSVGGVTGPSARVTIAATQPSILTADGSGAGLYQGTATDTTVTLAVSGLGATRPALADGALPPNARVVPATAIVAFVGGVRTTATAAASTKSVGVFDVVVDVPPSAHAGDLIYVVSAGRPSNAVVFQTLTAPVIQMMPLPSGSPVILSMETPDLSGSFVIPYAARDASGCFAAWWFDMITMNSGTFNPCLVLPARTAVSPLILPPNSEVAGGLVGPPAAAPPAGVSSTVLIANADNDSMLTATLSGDAATLTGAANAGFLATIPGTPAQTQTINGLTGAVATVTAGGGAGAGGGGAGAGGGAPTSVNVNGLTAIVSTPVQIAAGQFGLVAADSSAAPTQAAYAVVGADGTVIASQAFPAGWLPLIPAKAPATGPAGGPAGGPAAGAAAVVETARFDAAGKTAYLLVRAADSSQDAFLSLPYDASAAPSTIPMPAGWFASSCSGAVRLTAISLHPASVFPGSNTAQNGFSNPCNASGFLVLDLTTAAVTAYPLGGAAQMNAASLANFNDFIYSTDLQRATATTVFVFDAASSAAYPIALPAGAPGFAATQTVPGSDWLLAPLTARAPGDSGFVQFDLEAGTSAWFRIPTGFTSLQIVGTFLPTGKIVARGLSQGTFQCLIFDLDGNVTPVPNPDGVASFGPPPAATPAAAARLPLPVGNPKSNTVSALAYDAAGNQIGVLLVNVP